MSGDPFAPLNGAGGAAGNGASPPSGGAGKRGRPAYRPIVPVPASAPPPPEDHPKLGRPAHRWLYRDAAGALLMIVDRFDEPGGKTFLPLVYAAPEAGGAPAWRRQALPPARPLYGLDELARRPEAPVLVCEGEKAADAGAKLFPDHVVVTSPGGAKAAAAADWSPLAGRRVTVWPDADAPGRDYATDAATRMLAAGAAGVGIVPVPGDFPDGWDLADALPPGVEPDGLRALLEAAEPFGEAEGEAGGGRKRGRTPQREMPIEALDDAELFHDSGRVAYITVTVDGHRETWPIRSKYVRQFLSFAFYKQHGSTLTAQTLDDILRILEARAVSEGACREVFVRVGAAGGNLYLDLCDDGWRQVEISVDGWRVLTTPVVRFIRPPTALPLPEPVGGEANPFGALRGLINFGSDADFILVLGFLVASLRPTGPFPLLLISGEQGSGKSLATRMLKCLVDPAVAPIRAAPRDERDLAIAAANAWIYAGDNFSSIPHWLADAYCRLATGAGFSTRRLHSDDEEQIFSASRPGILNAIVELASRPDLADRAVAIHLPPMPADGRAPEREVLRRFEAARATILGGLLDAASVALRRLPGVVLTASPRMYDFAEWAVAAEPAFGLEGVSFLDSYMTNRRDVAAAAFDADPFATAVRDFVLTAHPLGIERAPSALYAEITAWVPEATRKARAWPANAAAFGGKLKRAAGGLRSRGFIVEFVHSGDRRIRIEPTEGAH